MMIPPEDALDSWGGPVYEPDTRCTKLYPGGAALTNHNGKRDVKHFILWIPLWSPSLVCRLQTYFYEHTITHFYSYWLRLIYIDKSIMNYLLEAFPVPVSQMEFALKNPTHLYDEVRGRVEDEYILMENYRQLNLCSSQKFVTTFWNISLRSTEIFHKEINIIFQQLVSSKIHTYVMFILPCTWSFVDVTRGL